MTIVIFCHDVSFSFTRDQQNVPSEIGKLGIFDLITSGQSDVATGLINSPVEAQQLGFAVEQTQALSKDTKSDLREHQ
jgi:hypothetical protein